MMRSYYCCSSLNLGLAHPCSLPSINNNNNNNRFTSIHYSPPSDLLSCFKISGSIVSRRYGRRRRRFLLLCTMDWDSVSSFSLDDRADTFSASEGEESDGDIILNPINDVDIPTSSERFRKPDDALTATAYELRMIGRSQKKSRIKYGMAINIGLLTFLTVFLLLLDSHAWRIVRLPLPPFHLICPFTASTILVSFAGYICVPLFRISRMQMLISKWPARRSFKKGTTTMGGLFLIPIGVAVAEVLVGFSSMEVAGASITTLAFATIGLIDDFLCLVKRRRVGLSPWIRVLLEVAVGTWFYFWLCARNIASPYSMYSFL